MEWYFYLNYYIYRFYKKYGDQIPVFSAGGATTLLVCLNIFTVYAAYGLITDFWVVTEFGRHHKFKMVTFMAFFGLINYLLLYRNRKYVDIFDDFKTKKELYKKWDKLSLLYIVLSVALLLTVLIVADWRNRQLGMFS